MKEIYKQKANPKAAMPSKSLAFFLNAANKMTTYPVRPISGVGIPKVLATGPEMIASQLTLALMVQGLNEGLKNCSQRRKTAKNIPITERIFTQSKYLFLVVTSIIKF